MFFSNFVIEFADSSFFLLSLILMILLRISFVTAIYFDSKSKEYKKDKLFIIFAFLLPLVSGITYALKNRKTRAVAENHNTQTEKLKMVSIICSICCLFLLFITLAFSYLSAINNAYDDLHNHFNVTSNITESVQREKQIKESIGYYDIMGKKYRYLQDVVYYDSDGYRYTGNYETVICLDNNKSYEEIFCYVDKNGDFYFDSDRAITVKDKHSCANDEGELYYPLHYVRFDKDGHISCDIPNALYYDKNKNAYISDNAVPFYDEEGNRLFYNFNSDTQEGKFETVDCKIKYDSNNCFVDSQGILVYDNNHTITIASKYIPLGELSEYFDEKGNRYYRASDIIWDHNGKIIMRW